MQQLINDARASVKDNGLSYIRLLKCLLIYSLLVCRLRVSLHSCCLIALAAAAAAAALGVTATRLLVILYAK